jgi:nitroreductase
MSRRLELRAGSTFAPDQIEKRGDHMNVLEAISQRRAVRSYTTDAVTEGHVRQLLDAAVRAPTAMHEEPWAFCVIQDRALLKRLSDRAKHAWSPPRDGSQAVGASRHPTEEARAAELIAAADYNIFYDAGTLILICARPKSAFVAADCWLAAENLMLAACEMGLATCPVGFSLPFFNQTGVKAELGIPLDVTVVVPIIVGLPREQVLPTARKAPEILSWRKG